MAPQGKPRLRSDDVLFFKAFEDRCRLQTVSCGSVHLDLCVITKHFKEAAIDM